MNFPTNTTWNVSSLLHFVSILGPQLGALPIRGRHGMDLVHMYRQHPKAYTGTGYHRFVLAIRVTRHRTHFAGGPANI